MKIFGLLALSTFIWVSIGHAQESVQPFRCEVKASSGFLGRGADARQQDNIDSSLDVQTGFQSLSKETNQYTLNITEYSRAFFIAFQSKINGKKEASLVTDIGHPIDGHLYYLLGTPSGTTGNDGTDANGGPDYKTESLRLDCWKRK